MKEYRVSDRLRVVIADIATLPVDVIVNAANRSLLGGGGVDGAIHDAAGPDLLAACKVIAGCPTGQARMTPGFRLPARWVIHAVGPVWRGDGQREADLLRDVYTAALRLAAEAGARTMAVPCISAGAYGYPLLPSCEIAVATVTDWQAGNSLPFEITFCCWLGHEFREYQRQLSMLAGGPKAEPVDAADRGRG